MIHTFNLFGSPAIFSEAGTLTDGDKFDAVVTGIDVHLFQLNGDGKLAILVLSEPGLPSRVRRELVSPSATMPFLLKLKPCKKPPDDELPLLEPCD